MIKKIIVFIINSFCLTVFAQQKPQYTQYILNNFVVNPALSGIENYWDVKISNRQQWTGIAGAPVTSYITFHAPIGKKDFKTNITSFEVPGQNPRGKNYWEEYTAAAPHHGVGFVLVNDKTDFINRTTIQGTYAYHLGISTQTSLAAGFGAGITTVGLDKSKIKFANPNDPGLASNTIGKLRPEISAGLWLYSKKYYLGLSAQNVIPQKFAWVDGDGVAGRLEPHFFLSGGYRFFLSDDVSILPSTMLIYQYNSTSAVSLNANVKAQYLDKVWLGTSYRFRDGFAAMAGLNISNTVNIGYAYDYTTTRLGSFAKGTHEIIIGFLLKNTYGDSCPRNVW
jgi:type IX secretion system PorP/SprF family membrane protein